MPPDSLILKNLTEIKLGRYAVGPATCLTDPRILPAIQQYKRSVASQLTPLAQADVDRKIPESDYLISRKIDGEFNVLIFRDGQIFTVNPGGTVRLGLPWFKEATDRLQQQGVSDAMIAGELYVEPAEPRRPRVHDVVSVVRQPADQHQLSRVKFAVFDWLTINGAPADESYAQTWQRLEKMFAGGTGIHPVETVAGKDARDVNRQFQQWVVDEQGEGVVARSSAAGNFKIKPLYTLDAAVIGFTEASDDRQGMLHDLLVAIGRSDGSLQVLCRVGGGFSDDQRRAFLSDLKDHVVDSEYAEVNSDHVAYQMVRPECVIEMTCLDLISQNTRGKPVNRMVLEWDAKNAIYRVVRRMPLVSVISPQFKRVREDKTVNPQDIRIGQIEAVSPIPMSTTDARELSLAKSQMLKREVYVKTLRGETLVRKFLLWKTNKDHDSEQYPAFVAYHTDFSPSRKVPLTREVRVSNSKTQILALFNELKEDNIKKGWELHSETGGDFSE